MTPLPTCWRCGRRIVCAIYPRLLCDRCGRGGAA